MFCCRALGEDPRRWPIYRKLFQGPEIENDTEAIVAAFLFVMAHRDDGSMRKPASVFVQRCKDFHQASPPNPTVYAEAKGLVSRYGQLTYAQLREQLKEQRTQAAQVQQWQPPEPRSVGAYQTPKGLLPIPSRIASPQEIRIELATSGGMGFNAAEHLRREIAHDTRFGLCSVKLVALQDASYGVYVRKEGGRLHERVLYAPQEWQSCATRITNCYEFFGEQAHPAHAWKERMRQL
jgi:hypothetical protein